MLSSVCTRIDEQGPTAAHTGHIVIHHLCRSRLVGGAQSPLLVRHQANAIANSKIEPNADLWKRRRTAFLLAIAPLHPRTPPVRSRIREDIPICAARVKNQPA